MAVGKGGCGWQSPPPRIFHQTNKLRVKKTQYISVYGC